MQPTLLELATMYFKRSSLRVVACSLALGVLARAAMALEPFSVRDIRVEGLQRVEAGTIFASLPVRVGDTYTDDKAAASIRTLFGLGLFKDVRIEASNGVLVVIVEERPIVADVTFTGTQEFDRDVLKKALREVGISDGRPFDKALLDRAEQELKRQYINKSMYGTEIVTTVNPIERNRVNLNFAVIEGDVAKISKIKIWGATAFPHDTLLGLFDSDSGTWLSWYTKSNRYSRTKLNSDIEILRSHYLSRGYLEFKVDSTQVAISPNKQDIEVTINVTEGAQFVVSGIQLLGNYLEKNKEFQSLIAIKTGEAYNANDVTSTTKAFNDYFANFGYAFARTEVRTVVDRETNRVAIDLVAEPSRRVYVRRINVAGNNRTRDEVIRREFRQLEAAWYDGEKIRQSRNRVDRLGHFTQVNIETLEVSGAPDQVDLTVSVVEKSTGSLSLGAGISTADGLGLSFGYREENAFGSGNSLGIELNTSKTNRTVVLSTTNPYFTEDGVSRSLDFFQRTSRPFDDVNTYAVETTGAAVRFGVPFTDTDTVFLGVGADRTRIIPGTLLPTVYEDHVKEFGASSTAIPLTAGWARDTRDSALVPSSGKVLRANAEWSIGGELRYVRGTAQYQHFLPLSRKVTAAFNSEVALGAATTSASYPVFKNYYAGGLGSVRGFEQGSLTTASQRAGSLAATGGAKRITVNAELLAPLPGGGNDRTLRVYGFIDAGGIYGANESIQIGDLRSSFGVGISWISPVGPLRLAFARPITKFEGDKIQGLQFQIGTTF